MSIWHSQRIIVEAIFVIPESNIRITNAVNCICNIEKMLKKFAGNILIGSIVFCQSR
jgi:hypothetical protein